MGTIRVAFPDCLVVTVTKASMAMEVAILGTLKLMPFGGLPHKPVLPAHGTIAYIKTDWYEGASVRRE